MKKSAIVVGKYLLVLFFLYYYIGITGFVHTHHNAKGNITHSHPFFPGRHHSHSEISFKTIGALDLLIVDATFIIISLPLIAAIIGIILEIYNRTLIYNKFLHPSFRAPPLQLSV